MTQQAVAERPYLVMAKIAGPICTMRCAYCYYLGKERSLPRAPGRLPVDLLDSYIAQRLAAAPAGAVHFEWHGGEPTLAGLDYFRSIVRSQRAHAKPGQRVTNGLQTNGIALNGAWAGFLAAEHFSVGLSLDGPARVHDTFRRDAEGKGTHARVEATWRLLKERGVFVNVLSVLSAAAAPAPDEVYDYFRELGVTHLQLLPLVEGVARPGTAAPAQDVGRFLCRVFDRWIREDVGRVVIQNIDEALRPCMAMEHSLCVHRETCGQVAVLERDGGLYACDHFVDQEHRLGSLRDTTLAALAADPRMAAFGEAKRDGLPGTCRACDVLAWCNGGCPKDREPGGINRLCAGYRMFFQHCRPHLATLAAHMMAGRPLREFAVDPAVAQERGTDAP